jgi:hypothetical protein
LFAPDGRSAAVCERGGGLVHSATQKVFNFTLVLTRIDHPTIEVGDAIFAVINDVERAGFKVTKVEAEEPETAQ